MIRLLSITAGIVLLGGQVMEGRPSAKLQCNAGQINTALGNGDLDAALTMTQHCIDEKRADLETLEKEYGGKPSDFVDVVGLAELTAGSFLCAKPVILALKGALPEAESALADAEEFDRQHPHSAMSWSMIGAPLATARAFVLEM